MSALPAPAQISALVLAHDDGRSLQDCLDSLAGQTLGRDRFEIVVAAHAEAIHDAVLLWRATHPGLRVTVVDADPIVGWNAALDAATGTHATFVDSRDRVAPRMLERLLDRARPDAVTLTAVGLLPQTDGGEPSFDHNAVAALLPFVGRPATRADLAVALSGAGGKLVPLALARAVRFREDLRLGAELVFWAEVLATGVGLELAQLSADAAYLQRAGSATETVAPATSTIGALQALQFDDAAALTTRDLAVEKLIREQVRPYVVAHPDELRNVRRALRAAGVSDKRAPLQHHAAREVVFLGTAPARDASDALLAERLDGHAVDVAVHYPDGAEVALQELLAPAADVTDALLTSYGPAQPSWTEVGSLLARLQPELSGQEGAKRHGYESIRSIGASPLEHLSAALAKLSRPTARWTADIVVPAAGGAVAGSETTLEGDAWFQVLGAGLIEAGYAVDDVPEQLDLFTEMVTLGLADAIRFDTREQAEQILGRCPSPEIAARAREVVQITHEPVEMIKLVIWDLDETFWEGTLAEDGHVRIPEENIAALKELSGRGIVNSICSKNHHDAALAVLQERGIADYFVFPRIAFAPKGEAVKQLIADMGLRDANVLFIDDNPGNLAEVAYYNPGIRTLDAAELPRLLTLPGTEGKPDPGHQRLAHYRLLQERHGAQAQATSNEEFLRSSGLRIQLQHSRPEDAERIHDMILRTNQLNFTKKRIGRDEVERLLTDPTAQSATVRVQDNFGDYGIVGWYYLRAGVLEHFLFSCRTINLGIEQHVYAHLGHPALEVVGETAGDVGPDDVLRDYITLEEVAATTTAGTTTGAAPLLADEDRLSVFALSACDLFQAVGRLALPMVDLTFECNTFRGPQRGVNTGTEYIRSCAEMSAADQAYAREHFLNYQGATAFATEIFARPYDYVVLGIHDDLTFGQYRHKTRRDLVVQLDLDLRAQLRPLGVGDRWAPLIDGHDQGEPEPGATWLYDEFDDEGLISPERFRENLAWILARLHPGTQLLLATAPEMAFFRNGAPDFPLLRERAVLLNRVVREFCAAEPRAHVVEMNDVIYDRAHVTDYVMHLTAERGHALAQLILEQMAAHPSAVADRRAQLGLGERPITLWDVNAVRGSAVAQVMTAAGLAPDHVVGLGGTLPRTDTFVLAVADEGDERISSALTSAGCVPGTDFRVARPWVFSPDWQEARA